MTLSYDGSSVYQALISAEGSGLGKATASSRRPDEFAQYVAPWLHTKNGLMPMGLSDVCLGPDGNMWITGASSGSIEKVDESGNSSAPIRSSAAVRSALRSERIRTCGSRRVRPGRSVRSRRAERSPSTRCRFRATHSCSSTARRSGPTATSGTSTRVATRAQPVRSRRRASYVVSVAR